MSTLVIVHFTPQCSLLMSACIKEQAVDSTLNCLTEFQTALHAHEYLGFQVSVQNPFVVDVLRGGAHLGEPSQNLQE